MKILLHIGQSKTGTSAIQAFLSLNRHKLAEKNILYPVTKINNLPLENGNHNSLADALVGHISYPFLSAKEYFENFHEQARKQNAKLMILSAEHFFGGQPRVWDVEDERIYFEKYKEKISILSQYVEGYQLSVVVYLRPQLNWLASAISQTIRIERLIRTKAIYKNDIQFFEMVKPLLQYARLLRVWESELRPKEMIVIPYERNLLHKQSSIADFIHRIGLDDLDFPYAHDKIQVNQSFSREYVEVKKLLNKTPKSKNKERVIIKCLEQLSARDGNSIPYTIHKGLEQEVRNFVEFENALLTQRYGSEKTIFRAASTSFEEKRAEGISSEMVERALKSFTIEYRKPRTKLMLIDQAIRAYLRKNALPLHSVLHQLKRLILKAKYKN